MGRWIDDYRTEHAVGDRWKESNRIIAKYPDRVPVIADSVDEKTFSFLKHKFLVPADLTFAQLVYVVRKHMAPVAKVNLSEMAVFPFVKNGLVMQTKLVSEIYHEHKDSDGFLYVEFSPESVFGNSDSDAG